MRKPNGELCVDPHAPMIMECPDCVDAFIEKAREMQRFAIEMAYQVWDAKNLKEAHQAVAGTVSTYKRPAKDCHHSSGEGRSNG